ncbi:putative 2,3-bisphosphoglycerate-independent phosphoglycerate mutase [Desulfuromonas versatilis]|uniref:2,3-bisphosphoglycerate-independent phosphoglycerate mutase n=1 Tax=Desulfuromonas versatilis TaxID=2802975 RepID=A0ABM8HVT5_9BACT|nr:cofactor-independent phosphoglycerate mutase [Desulfuromonas versatilis]BCR04812.1 putative 2,3-bisphosphoglycerate-independent phosphoglycerate mutase [Desulfuromonas versatilis]
MKYLVLLGDGMADEPIEELKGKTPLEFARTPRMDQLADQGEIGMVETIPPGFHPGSDVANLSVFGYDPALCYSGRSPLEAASMGVELGPEDVAFRLNLVYLVAHYGKLYMGDFSAGHISTAEARQIIATLQQELGDEEFHFYPGVSYRHLMVWRGGKDKLEFTPPHDLTGQSVEGHMPRGEGAERLIQLMNSAQLLLHRHPVNLQREQQDKPTANSIWLWGHGRPPRMETLQQRFGISGAVISAVDLIKGIGTYAGLDVIEVPGATGYIDTNYVGKAEYALEALKSRDFVYLHVEAPDEAAHAGNLQDKIRAIEDFDQKVVGTILDGIGALGDYRLLVLPDHPTPLARMTHTSDPVPYILYGSGGEFPHQGEGGGYCERSARAAGVKLDQGHRLMARLIRGEKP